MPDRKLQGVFLHFSRLLAGIVFVYSGFVKGIDPLGSTYKFSDYFVAFNIEFLEFLAFPLAVILSATEMVIGMLLLSGVYMAIASWAVLLFMGFFTILTFFIALTDPVADCGCFGDAIILTNWQTFWKNAILMVFVINLFVQRKKFNSFFSNRLYEWATLALFLSVSLAIPFHSYMNLPVIDYRPFHTGANIGEKMSVPPDAPGDEYEIILYYEKDGEVKAFSVEDIPDPSWEWVRTESNLVSKGYEPPIANFHIVSPEGSDYTWDILNDSGYTFIIVSHDLSASLPKHTSRINRLSDWSRENGIGFICLTASPESQISDFREKTGAEYEFFHTDGITLKTIIRSNPGLMLIKEGTILGKWHYRNIPHTYELHENLLAWSLELNQDSKNKVISLGFILALMLILALTRSIRSYLAGNYPVISPGKGEKKKKY
jgi:hypothetical protein